VAVDGEGTVEAVGAAIGDALSGAGARSR
jgi:hypothetical protein